MAAGIVFQGSKELIRALHKLPDAVHQKVAKAGLRPAANIVLAKARANVRARPGGSLGATIARYLHLRVFANPWTDWKGMVVEVGHRGNDELVVMSKSGQRNYLPAAIEYGHRGPGQGGKGSRGRPNPNAMVAPAYAYMRNAYESTREQAIAMAETTILKGVQREFAAEFAKLPKTG